MEILECVSFILVEGNSFLVERRRLDKPLDPGAVAIPGGHLEDGESPIEALHRELAEELAVTAGRADYVCTLLHRSEEFCKLHYYAVWDWSGDIEKHEAEALLWLRFDEVHRLDLPVDHVAIAEYLRIYQAD